MGKTLQDLRFDGYIDSRDILERLAALEDEEALDEDEREERDALKSIDEEGSGLFADWQYGETLVPDRDFEEYAQQLAEDIGAIGSDLQWPLYHIDWEAAADSLKMDYSSIEIEGTLYWGRSG